MREFSEIHYYKNIKKVRDCFTCPTAETTNQITNQPPFICHLVRRQEVVWGKLSMSGDKRVVLRPKFAETNTGALIPRAYCFASKEHSILP